MSDDFYMFMRRYSENEPCIIVIMSDDYYIFMRRYSENEPAR